MPRRTQEAPYTDHCAMPGCAGAGVYKAPRSRKDVHDYQWLCLEHIRAFNKEWNFFTGMTDEEIMHFQHDAVTGHRPTWTREGYSTAQVEEALRRFMHGQPLPRRPRVHARERSALATLELDAPCDLPALKKHYRALVKRTHPDLHKGDRAYEEKFKAINVAYRYLLELYSK